MTTVAKIKQQVTEKQKKEQKENEEMTVKGYSMNQLKNARMLVKTEAIARIDENTWQVKSVTNVDKSYFIDHDKCECMGSVFNGQCVHTAAIELYQREKEDV